MYEGAPNYPEPDRFWRIIDRHRVSVFYTAPTAIRTFVKWGEQWPRMHRLDSLRLLGTVEQVLKAGESRHGSRKNWQPVDFAAVVKVGTASVASVQTAVAAPQPMVIAAGVLMLAQALVDSTTVKITEDEASLFWAIVQTAGDRDDKTVSEDELRAASERHRGDFGLEPLTPAQFTKSLRRLESLSSIRPQGEGRWRLTEKYRVS